MINSDIKGVLILAAGYGSRMKPVTLDTPKPMIKIWDEPILERLLKQINIVFPKVTVAINVSYLSESIIEYCLKIPIKDRPEIIFEFEPQGTLSSVLDYSKNKDGMIVVFHGDLVIDKQGLFEFKKYISGKTESIVAVHSRNLLEARSIVKVSDANKVLSIVEVKTLGQEPTTGEIVYSNSGIYFLNSSQIKKYPKVKGESISPNLLNWIINSSTLIAYEWEGKRFSIETIEDINKANLIEKFF